MATNAETVRATPSDGAATRKKVRLACQRCRDRRIKCDGEVPSCSKCAKAGLPCIDVDARRAGNALPRAFLSDAQARLEWLEDIVRTQLPGVNLDAGPRKPDEPTALLHGVQQGRRDFDRTPTPFRAYPDTPTGTKRQADLSSSNPSGPVLKSARRMAMDLGLFSLHPNASQAHYLGSSSGSLFAELLRRPTSSTYQLHGEVQDVDEASDPETDGSEEAGQEKNGQKYRSQEIVKRLQEALPPRQECDRMIKHFFAHYHPDYPVLHQPSFRSLVDALYGSAQSQTASLQHNGWPGDIPIFRYNDEVAIASGQPKIAISINAAATHLFFVLSIASHVQTRKRSFKRDPGRFTAQAMSLFQLSLSDVSVSSVQSIVLCVLQEFLTSEGGSMWILLHIAMSFAIDLGLHRCHPISVRTSAVAVHMRRRIFFTLYSLERYISTAQGRPIGFRDDTLDLTMPLALQPSSDDEATQFDQALFSYSVAHFQWATIVSDLKYQLYRFQAPAFSSADLLPLQQSLQSRLDVWLGQSLQIVDSLPSSHQSRLRTKVRIEYNFAAGLLYQPSQACPAPDTASLRLCFESAKQRIQLYDSLYTQNSLLLSWPSTHGIFLSGAILVYCLWSSAEIRASVSISDVAKTMRLCSSLLTLGGEWWPLAQRGKRSFEKLADSTLQLLLNPVPAPDQSMQQQPMIGEGPPIGNDDLMNALPGPEWFDVESMLQSFLQNDFQFSEMLDTLDDHPSVGSFDL